VREAEEDDKAMWIDVLYGDEVAAQHTQSQKYRALLSDIAGGDYWQAIIQDGTVLWEEKCARLVGEYRQRLRDWFKLVEALPVCSDKSASPKYWIAFMSRYEPAFDLFNRAACHAVREQHQNVLKQPDMLFADIKSQPEIPEGRIVDRAVKRASQINLPCRWNELRWRTCGNRNVGKFTDSEVNQSIKRLLKEGWLSGASGTKIEETKVLSPTEQLKSWVDR
jgi:hypothetical protein